jgi:predicted kinase
MIYILRGLPGSGKSTFAKTMDNAFVVSADDYHVGSDGVYRFDPKRAGYAHNECLSLYITALTNGSNWATTPVIVDNTNTTLVELAPYVRIAEALDLEYVIRYFVCPLEVAAKRQTHGVPLTTMLAMQRNLLTEIVPAHWKQEVILP